MSEYKPLTHEEADELAQRFLGNIEPGPGETPREYHDRLDRATASFQSSHPNWRGGLDPRDDLDRLSCCGSALGEGHAAGCPQNPANGGPDRLYLSHSAGRRANPDWWIVEPRKGDSQRLAQQIGSLLNLGGRGRRVIEIDLEPGKVTARELYSPTDLPRGLAREGSWTAAPRRRWRERVGRLWNRR